MPCTRQKNTPPIPSPDASQAPSTDGAEGTTSASRVGRFATSLASWRKSASIAWACFVSRRRGRSVSSCRKASCSKEKRPLAPGIAIAIDLSSPMTLCQRFVGTCFVVGAMSSTSFSRSTRWGGSCIVFALVSTTHPRMVFRVVQVASPFRSFLAEAGSCRCGLS